MTADIRLEVSYKGQPALIYWREELRCFVGEVPGFKDMAFEIFGATFEEAKADFKRWMDEYLADYEPIKKFRPIEVDIENLTIMGVPFPDLELLESYASGLGSSMYSGFKPTKRRVEIGRDYFLGITSKEELINIIEMNLDE